MCELCMLHYETEELAKKCEAWDRLHDSCNLAIASRSIEAISRRESLSK